MGRQVPTAAPPVVLRPGHHPSPPRAPPTSRRSPRLPLLAVATRHHLALPSARAPPDHANVATITHQHGTVPILPPLLSRSCAHRAPDPGARGRRGQGDLRTKGRERDSVVGNAHPRSSRMMAPSPRAEIRVHEYTQQKITPCLALRLSLLLFRLVLNLDVCLIPTGSAFGGPPSPSSHTAGLRFRPRL